jgi:hypothetical protein
MKFSVVFLWLSPPILQTWLAALLMRRRVIGRFRFFFVYTLFAIGAEIAKFAFRANPATYFHVFLATQPIYALLGYLAIAEIFYGVFKNFHRIWWFQLLFPVFGILALGLSILIVALRPPKQANEFLATVFVLEIIVRCLQLGVFFLIFGLANFFSLSWRQYSFGITAGFGLAACGILAAIVGRSIFGTKYAAMLQFVPSVTYLLAVLIWLVSFLKPLPLDPLRDVRPLLTPEMMRELYERYKRLTKGLFRLCTQAF